MQRINLTIFNAFLLVGFLGVITPASGAAAEPPKRLHSNIDGSHTYALTGHTRPVITQGLAQDQGEVSNSLVMPRMAVHFALSSAQQTDLNQFLVSVQDRRSANYHKFLTPEQYAARFGVNDADIAKVTAWLSSNGFTNVQVARSKTWVSFNGSAGEAAAAFHTSIHKYTLNGEARFANATDPQLPKALQGMVLAVSGLHNFRMKSHVHMRPHLTSSQTGNTFLAPGDWATIYDVQPLYGAGLDGSPLGSSGTACGGSPCSIVVVGQSDVLATDLAAFRAAAGLPAKTITVIVPPYDNDPGLVSGDEGESDLDLEWANGVAKNANVLFVTADATVDNGVVDAMTYAIDNNVAPILSTSYGLCEPYETAADMAAQSALFAQGNVQGMTIVSASGDQGAADCDTGYPATGGLAVDFPASSPYVTGVGGTELTVADTTTGGYWAPATSSLVDNVNSALKYIPEIVWNDTAADVALGSPQLAASGGGVSTVYAKPAWQVGTGVPADGHRDVPDIALTASPNQDGLLICSAGWCTNGFRDGAVTTGSFDVYGGTSAGAPTFSAVLAMLVQQTGSRLGNINPNLYAVAAISQTGFHDITSGSNIVPCRIGTLNCTTGSMGYSAGVGYDQTTGWGSIDAYNLVEQWSEDIEVSASPTTLTVQPGASGSATVTVGPYKGFTGTVSFACSVSSGLANVTCSVPSTTVTTSGSTTVTITAASTAATPFWRQIRRVPPAGLGLLVLALGMAVSLFYMRKQRFVYAWGAATLLILMLGAVSCGGGSSSGTTTTGSGSTGPVAESGTVTVTATSGQIVNSATIAVTIP